MNQFQEHTELVDRYFLHSYKKLQSDLKTQIHQYLFRFVLICIILPLNNYLLLQTNQESKNRFSLFLLIILGQNFLQTIRHLYFYLIHLKNRNNLMRIASTFNHCLSQDQLRIMAAEELTDQYLIYQVDTQSQLKVSTVFYDFENKEKNNDVQQQYKAVRQKLGQNSIKSALETQVYFYRSFGCLLDFCSANVLIYSAILCFNGQLTETQNTLVQIYLLFEIIFKTKVFGILLLIALIPLFLILGLVYVCFCKREQKANLPKVQQITNTMISRCSECAICFQNFQQKEEVIQLPCSNLHIFHQGCIDKWAKINPKCPICRHNLI